MAVAQKIRSLERFVAENPALADVPALTVAGRPTTPREALNYLRAGRYVSEVISELAALGLSPPPWELAEEFYRRLAAARVKIVTLGFIPPISPAEALRHVQARDETGRMIVQSYAKLLDFMKVRMQ